MTVRLNVTVELEPAHVDRVVSAFVLAAAGVALEGVDVYIAVTTDQDEEATVED